MKTNFWSAFFLVILLGCGENAEQDSITKSDPLAQKTAKKTSISGLVNNQRLTIGDTLEVKVEAAGDVVVDSIELNIVGKSISVIGNELSTSTLDLLPGKYTLTFKVSVANDIEKHSIPVEFLSDIVPIVMGYERVNYYTHDPGAYTQGLFYHDGYLYENTGRKGESSLRKVEITSGKVIEQSFLADQYFGEGITKWKDQIIQLTWTSNQGFIYTLEGFEQIKSFNYPTEGWGITSLENELVMSDGTETLYFMDPETLLQTRNLQVYDHEGAVNELNELEYIDGLIYANVYQTDDIITIDPKNGKVLTRIDLSGLMNAQWGRPINVLNGIAYDESNKRLFVTGKLWPRLYEIRVVEKKPA